MAPQNLNQVFIANNPDMALAGTSFSINAAATASNVNVWNVETNANIAASTALTTLKRIQITQTMPSGNCIASPTIEVKDIKRINYREWTSVNPLVALQTIDFGTPTASKNVMLRIALRTAPTTYESFANPSNTYNDLSGAGKVFPLVGNFAAGRMIFNIEIAAATHGGSETALVTAMYNAIVANTTLNAIFLAADNGAAGLALTARHYGVQFDVTSQYSDGSGPVGTTALTQITPVAASNYIIALGDEKKQRARYGNFNRMYFPFAFPEFSQPSFKYDLIEIQYAHNHPSSTGIARAGELNTIRIYVGASSTALSYAGASTGTEVATAFGYVGGTDSEQLFS